MNVRTIEVLYAGRFVIHIDTFDIALHFAHKQLIDSPICFGTLVIYSQKMTKH